MTEMLGVQEIAERTGLTVGTVQVYSSRGKLPPPDGYISGGRFKWWHASTIDEWDRTRTKRSKQ